MRSSKIFLTSARITSLLCLSRFHMARSRCWDTELKCCSFLSTVRTWCTECSCFLLPTLIYFPLFHLYYIHPNTYSDDINAEIATVSYRAVCSLLRWQSRSPKPCRLFPAGVNASDMDISCCVLYVWIRKCGKYPDMILCIVWSSYAKGVKVKLVLCI